MKVCHEGMVCLACGCLCDDIGLVVEEGRVAGVRNACPRGDAWFCQDDPEQAVCWIDGAPAELAQGIDLAARWLIEAQRPLVRGLEQFSIEGQQLAVKLAYQLGAVVLAADASALPFVLAQQDVGAVGCSLGEIRHRARLVVVWFADPLATHPRHFERYSLDCAGEFVPRGREDRFLVVIDEQPTETSARADRFLQVESQRSLDVLAALRSLVRGVCLDPAEVEERTGHSYEVWQDLADQFATTPWGALLFEPARGSGVRSRLENEAILRLVRELSERTRFAASPLTPPGNPRGAAEVLLWSTGFPLAADLARHTPLPPHDHAACASADTILDGNALASACAATSTLRPPRLIAFANSGATAGQRSVVFRTARLGIHTSGTVFRGDGVPLPARGVVPTSLPDPCAILAQLLAALSRRLDPHKEEI